MAGLVLAVAFAAAQLSVDFIDPARFTDAGYDRATPGEKDRQVVQRDLTAHLQALADRTLPAGARLHIEVLDIDLAGGFEPFALPQSSDLRVVRDVTWPRLKLRYRLTLPDGTVRQGEETVSDMNFLATFNRYPSGDRLRHERAMLDDWFPRRFGGAAPGR